VIACAECDGVPFLLIEMITNGKRGRSFEREFGAALARLHQQTRADAFGFAHDNYLGRTPQPNAWHNDWVAFFAERRLGHQLQLTRQRGLATRAFERDLAQLIGHLDQWLAEPAEPPCLLHGDLWGGNYLVDEHGAPVLIDPACYYGRRETDLAMTQLFGGFGGAFYEGYEAVWPLADGADERLAIYQLYHLLNHLNLFGASYLSQCQEIVARFV
jgi:fructosamine-3-kinase